MYDVIVKGGLIVDGTGARGFDADIGIREGTIEAIGNLSSARAETIIDAKGKYVTPGFVDINNHSDTHWQIFLNPDLESLVRQGITTLVGGNCGSSLAPLTDKSMLESIQKWTDIRNLNLNWLSVREFLEEVEQRALPVNFATLLGHGTLRRGFVRDESRPLRAPELSGMAKLLKLSLREGSIGMSLGLAYVHGRHATEHELSTLSAIVGKYDGFCAVHLRNEGKMLPEAVTEVLTLAKTSGVRLHLSHLKALGRESWPHVDRALYLLDAFDSQGIDVSFDLSPYTSTASVLYTVLPTWVSDGGKKLMMERLRDPSLRARIVRELREEHIEYASAFLMASSLNKMIVRTNVLDIAKAEGKSPEEVILDVLLASDDRAIISFDTLSEENIEKELRHPFSLISTNGVGYAASHVSTGESVHPRSFGAFPRVLARYVREKKILSWEEAIHKMTGKPAQKAGLTNRGILAVGNFADLVVLDPETVEDHATLDNPYQYPSGIVSVLVNGKQSVSNGVYTGVRAGNVLRWKSSFFEKFW